MEVVSVSKQGLPTVRMRQQVGGVEVFQSDMTAAVSTDNQVISVAGQMFHGAATAPSRAAARAQAAATDPGTLKAEEAIAKAAFDLTGYAYKPSDFKVATAASRRASGPYRFYSSKWKVTNVAKDAQKDTSQAKARSARPSAPRFTRPVRVKDVLFPLGQGEFVPGYFIELWIEGYPAFSYVVDAVDTPDVLFRKNLTSSVAFKYSVHNTPRPIALSTCQTTSGIGRHCQYSSKRIKLAAATKVLRSIGRGTYWVNQSLNHGRAITLC